MPEDRENSQEEADRAPADAAAAELSADERPPTAGPPDAKRAAPAPDERTATPPESQLSGAGGVSQRAGAADRDDARALNLAELDPGQTGTAKRVDPGAMDMLADVELGIRIELGRTRMMVEDVLRLAEGSVVELDRLAGDPVDVFVNERLVARGEVLVLNDNFCVRIGEIVANMSEKATV